MAFAAIYNALNLAQERVKAEPDGQMQLVATGLAEAYDLMDALTNFKDHPVRRFVKGVRNTQEPTDRVREQRAVVAGTAVAYLTAQQKIDPKFSNRKAAEIVAALMPGLVTPESIRKWEKADREKVEILASAILEKATAHQESMPLSQGVLYFGKKLIDRTWVIPTY